MTKAVELTQGMSAIVDDHDFVRVAFSPWYARRSGNGGWSAASTRHGHLHRFVVGASEEQVVSALNGNLLDCRRSNLFVTTMSVVGQRRKVQKNNRSGFRGVSYDSRRGAFASIIRYKGRKYFLGYYENARDAAIRYDDCAPFFYGDLAKLNFPGESNG